MLTDFQKQKLTELMNNCPHEKLKPILLDAIPKWISGETKPRKGYLGIFEEHGKFRYDGVGSCLIGAALIGKNIICDSFVETLGIDRNLYFEIENAFDGRIPYTPEMEYVAKVSE